jgi:DNA-directed RNA polymerase specialized sigma24 family protein
MPIARPPILPTSRAAIAAPMSTLVDQGRLSTTIDNVEDLQSVPSPEDPAEALAAVVALRRLADRLEMASVHCAIEQGWTWAQVAEALGVSRQAAHKRYARRVRPGMHHEGGP